MRVFSKRYFVWISLIFLMFSGISFHFENLIFLLILGILLAGIYFILRKRAIKIKNLSLISLCLALSAILGAVNSQALLLKNENRLKKYYGEHTVYGYVREVAIREDYFSEYIFRVEAVDGESARFDIVLVADYKSDLYRGDFIEIETEIKALESYEKAIYLRNNNFYDYPLVCTLGEDESVEYLDKEFRIPLALSSLNSRLSSLLKAIMGTQNGSLASALLLGNRNLLSNETLRDFKRAGVYHLLALSGLHVAILIGILEWILKKLLVPTKFRIVLLGCISLFYIALTGFALSACRSMLMLWVTYISFLCQRKRDVMTSLFLAVSFIVLLKPSATFDVGLQLSFLSTFGIICASLICAKLKLTGVEKSKSRTVKSIFISVICKLSVVLISSLCVLICTLPVIMICFGEVSPATFLSNIFMGVVCEIFMILSILTLVFSKALVIYPIFSLLSGFAGNIMTSLVTAVSDMDGVMLSLYYPGSRIFVWGLFISFIVLITIHLYRKWLVFLPSIVFAVCMCISISLYNGVRADFVRAEYYYGDGIVISSNEGIYICDMSDGAFGNLYEGSLISKENCFTEIDGIILTHYHSDHIIALQRFAATFKLGAVYLPMPQNDKEELNMRSIVRVMSNAGIKSYIYESNEPLDILGGELVLSDRAYSVDYSHPSVALTFARGENRITLIGNPYFDTYLEKSGAFANYIAQSDYLIFGSDGRAYKDDFEIFDFLKDGCEVSFAESDSFLLSDYKWYLDEFAIYFDVHYKKYDLK